MSFRDAWKRLLPHATSTEETITSATTQDDKVCLQTFSHRYEADIVKSLLDGNDIPCYVSSEDYGGSRPALVEVTGGTRLWVARRHLEKARQVIESVPEGVEEDRSPDCG